MPHTVNYDPASGIAEVAFTGSITPDDLKKSTTECTSLQKRTGAVRFLVAPSESSVVVSRFDLVALPEEQYVDDELNRLSRIAVILPASSDGREAAQFYKTACANRGWNVQTFAERQSAIDWLTRN